MDREARITVGLKVVALIAISLLLALAAIEGLKLLGSSGIVMLAGILLTYLTLPVVRLMQRRMSLGLSLALTYVLFAIILVVAFVAVVPPVISEARALIAALPGFISSIQQELSNPQNALVQKLPPELRNYLLTLPAQLGGIATKYGLGVVQGTLGAFFSVISLFLSLIIVPIFSIYLFFDGTEAKRAFLGFVPAPARPKALAILHDLHTTIGEFIVGQVLDGVILGVIITVMLLIMHVRFALLIGVSVGILNLIPFVGAIIGFIPATLIALAFNGWQNAVIVGLLFSIIQQIDGNIILPRIMRGKVQLSPLILVSSILVFSAFFGLVGTFLAVPVTAMLRVLKVHFAPAPPEPEESAEETRALSLETI